MRAWLSRFACASLVLTFSCTGTLGQNAPVALKGPPMVVTIHRDLNPGCEPNCLEWISAEGVITPTTPQAFEKVFRKIGTRKPLILINSPGGSLEGAIAVARMVRRRGLDVMVARSSAVDCPAGKENKGMVGTCSAVPLPSQGACFSACPIILAAGKNRIVGAGGRVGVHMPMATLHHTKVIRRYVIRSTQMPDGRIVRKKELVSEKEVGRSTRNVEGYGPAVRVLRGAFAEMGVSPDVMSLVTATPFSSIRILTDSELDMFGFRNVSHTPQFLATLREAIAPPRPVPPKPEKVELPPMQSMDGAGTTPVTKITPAVPAKSERVELPPLRQMDGAPATPGTEIAAAVPPKSEKVELPPVQSMDGAVSPRNSNITPAAPAKSKSVEAPPLRSMETPKSASATDVASGVPLSSGKVELPPMQSMDGARAMLPEEIAAANAVRSSGDLYIIADDGRQLPFSLELTYHRVVQRIAFRLVQTRDVVAANPAVFIDVVTPENIRIRLSQVTGEKGSFAGEMNTRDFCTANSLRRRHKFFGVTEYSKSLPPYYSTFEFRGFVNHAGFMRAACML